ncbi:MAG: hypothetical protein MJ252_24870 [archaeon]|nr:hypothetical protein [archaeon]
MKVNNPNPQLSSASPSSQNPSNAQKQKAKSNENLKIMEWRFNQFLGESLSYDDIKNEPENESFLVTDLKFTHDGSHVVVTDKGGRVIIFKKNDIPNKPPHLDYFSEFVAQERDFDVCKSIDYSEEVRSVQILKAPNYENKLDILTAGYRTIKLDRVYKDYVKTFETEEDPSGIFIPKVKSTQPEIKCKKKRMLRCTHTNCINSLSLCPSNENNFISSDEFRVYLWDLNLDGRDVYTPVDIDPNSETETNVEKITKAIFCENEPNTFLYGTDRGSIKLCDLRVASEQLKFQTNYSDEKSNISNVIVHSLQSIHDIKAPPQNDYSFATRQFFSVLLWDKRMTKEPVKKFLTYEPMITKLNYIYQKNYINDKFSLDTNPNGKLILTGGYNNMFHIIDVEQKLNTQIVIDETNQKLMNTNVIRKINPKGSCFYKKDDPSLHNINFDKKILHQAYCPQGNFILLIVLNCIYSYSGNIAKKKSQGGNGTSGGNKEGAGGA